MQAPAADMSVLDYLLQAQWLLLILVALYFYFAFFLMVLARKTSTSHIWLAWIPIANLFQLCRIGRRSMLFAILLFIPPINIVAVAMAWRSIAQARGKPAWTGLLILVPGINLLLPLYLAAGPITSPVDAAIAAPAPVGASAARLVVDRCPRCGVAAEPDQRFCGECGLDFSAIETTVAPVAASATVAPEPPRLVMRSPAAIAGILAAIAVSALAGYVLFDRFGGSGDSRETSATAPPSSAPPSSAPPATPPATSQPPVTTPPAPPLGPARVTRPVEPAAEPPRTNGVAITPTPRAAGRPPATGGAATMTTREGRRIAVPGVVVTLPDLPTTATTRYSGPSTGTIRWSGIVEKGARIVLDDDEPSTGTMTGSLPGVPVRIQVLSKDIVVVEPPSPANGWTRIILQSRSRQSSLVLQWTILQ